MVIATIYLLFHGDQIVDIVEAVLLKEEVKEVYSKSRSPEGLDIKN